MDDVTDHTGGLGHHNRLGLYRAIDGATDTNGLAADVALHVGAFANRQSGAVDIAFDVAVDLDVTVALQVTGDPEIGADDGRHSAL